MKIMGENWNQKTKNRARLMALSDLPDSNHYPIAEDSS